MSHYVHYVPGRLRVKTPIVKHNEPEAVRLQNLLTGLDGVLAHEVKTVTGSIIIIYDKTLIHANAILVFLIEHGYMLIEHGSIRVKTVSEKETLPRAGSGRGMTFGRVIFGAALEKVVERSTMALIGAIL